MSLKSITVLLVENIHLITVIFAELLKEPTEQSSIKILYPDHLRLIVYDDDDDDEFDADAADETDEEDIVGDDDDMEEDEEDDGEEEEKDEKPRANKSKSRSHKEENGKGKQKEKTKEKKKIKGSKNEDEDMDGEDIEKEEEDSLQGPHMRLLFSVHNPREAHMIGGLQEVMSKIPQSWWNSSDGVCLNQCFCTWCC